MNTKGSTCTVKRVVAGDNTLPPSELMPCMKYFQHNFKINFESKSEILRESIKIDKIEGTIPSCIHVIYWYIAGRFLISHYICNEKTQ